MTHLARRRHGSRTRLRTVSPVAVRATGWAALLAVAGAMWTVGRRAAVAARRLELSEARARAAEQARCARLLHDHTMQIMEILNAGDHITDPTLRSYLADETAWLRRLIEVGLDPAGAGCTGTDLAQSELPERLSQVLHQFRVRGLHGRLVVATQRPVRLPGPVVEAFESAVTEALNNVLKHAGSRVATVTVRAGPTRIVVSVADRGAGFGAGTGRAGRIGIRHSVAGWMESIGGTGTVRSAVGHGTEVVLTYPVAGPPPGS